jgi:hypothetical protein
MEIFRQNEIPKELWNSDVLYVPRRLAELYGEMLKEYGVYDEALQDHKGKNVGGVSDEETLRHFSGRYLASVTRVEYLALNPKNEFFEIQRDVLSLLSDGKINILDIPCGTGAGILSLLITLAELRRNRLLPYTPLNIRISAGDISPKALEIYNKFLEKASPIVQESGVRLNWHTVEWDATKDNTTAQVLNHLLDNSCTPKEYLVFISAFSGSGKNVLEGFEHSLRQIESRLHCFKSTTLWIEPKEGESGFLRSIAIMLEKAKDWFRKKEKHLSGTGFKWFHPLTNKIHTGTMSVKKYSGSCDE